MASPERTGDRCCLRVACARNFTDVTRYDAYIEKDWENIGLGLVVIARAKEGGDIDLAVFLVDILCLGVKLAVFESGLHADDLQDYLDEHLPDEDRERIHPACAKKLIEGAVAYAEELGFAPHRDYRKARRILSGIEATVCPREFTYGSEGRPCYVRDDEDDDDRVARVCAILEAKLGAEGFFYEDPRADEEEALEQRDRLIDFLAKEEIGVPRFYEVSGLITAMLIGPRPAAPQELLPLIWPKGDRVIHTEEELRQFLEPLHSYWNGMSDRVLAAVHPECPVEYQILDLDEADFVDDQTSGLAMSAATMDWAKGFLRVAAEWTEAWADARSRPELAPHWEVIGWWAEFHRAENRDAIVRHAAAEPKRTLNGAVLALARALRPASGSE